MKQSISRVSGKGKVARVLLVALLSLVGLSVIGAGTAYGAAPVLKSLSPSTGTADGGTTVTIGGTGLTGATAVTFGGVPATSFTVNTGVKITAVAPPAANGTAAVAVVVTVAGVQSTPSSPGVNIYTYTWPNPPTVTGVGLTAGTAAVQVGSSVTVTAAGTYTVGQLVTLSGFSTPTSALPTAIYSVTSVGTGTFTVTNLGRTFAVLTGAVSPTPNGAVGPTGGGTSVVIVGTHLGGASAVSFGSTAATSFVVNSSTQITAVVPPGVSGGVDVTVTTPNATSPTSSADTFNYVGPPVVTGLTTTATPAGGATGGGTQVTIAGSGFSNVTAVAFGGTAATSFLVNGLNSITAVAPAGSGTVDVTVTAGGVTSPTSSADLYAYNGTLGVVNGNAAYSNSPGTSAPVTATSQTGTTVTLSAIGNWVTGTQVVLSGFTNGLTGGTYTLTGGSLGSFTVTFAGTTTGSGTGSVLIPNSLTPEAVTTTGQTGGVVTLTVPGTWFQGQEVYLTGFTNGLTTGNYPVATGTTGSFTVAFAGTTTGSGTGTAIPYQAQSFNIPSLVTGGGTINPTSVTVTAQPASGTVTAVGSQLIYIPAQTTPTSYVNGLNTTWEGMTTTTGIQTATFQICQTAPTAACTTGTMSYSPATSGYFVGNQLSAGGTIVTVVEDTGAGIVVPSSAASGSTFTSVSAPTEADLPATNSGFTVSGIGGYQSITPVPTGLSLVPGTLKVTGGDTATSGKYTATLCTAAMGYVPGTCTANETGGNFQTSYPYIETSLNVATQVPGGSQLSLPTISATWQVNATSGTVSSYETEFVVVTSVVSIGTLDLDAFPTDLASNLNQGQGAPIPTYAPPSPRWTVNITNTNPPTITSGNSATFTAGTAGTFTVTATGSPAPTFTETGTLPSGVTLNSTTGVLSGTPGAGTAGSYPITITAANGNLPNATQSFTLTVNPPSVPPTITSGNATTFAVGTAGTFTVTATGSPAPTFTETGTLPSGVTLNATTGVLSGTPGAGTGGTYPITITASNGALPNATQSFTLTVDQAPAITSGSSTTFTVGSAGTFTVTSTGFPAATYAETGTLPSGVTLNATTGVLSGSPGAGTGGTYPITITASNGSLPNATQSFTLTVDQAPAITSGNATTFTVGTAGTFTVTATGFPAPTFTETGTLPTGVTLNATTGVLSGTPIIGTTGSYPVTITAANGTLPNATQSFTLTVSPASAAPTITSGSSTTFTVGSAGTFTVTASGNPAPTFAETGTLPSGVSLNATTGVLSGTPAAGTGGTYPITITASNGNLPNATQSFTLTVDEAPAITSGNATTFMVGTAGTFTVTSTGFPAPTYAETGTLPTGVTLDMTTGVLSGTPAAGTGGSYPFTITASNGTLPNATQSFTLTVSILPTAPIITSSATTTFTVGSAGTFTVTASGSPPPVFNETGALPTGVSLNATTGVLSGTPGAGTAGSYPITITASNGNLPNATQSFTLTVNQAPAITSGSSTTFAVGTAGTFTVTATGSPAPTFAETGTLPTGVTLNATTGVLSGTPGAGTGGTYPITITASNGVSPNATQSFTLTVTAPPAITSGNATTFTVGTAGTFTVTASGFPASTFSEVGTLPTGVSLNATTGVLSGTPGAGTAGSYPIAITASNGNLPDATQSFTLTVNQAPAITSGSSTTFAVGTAGTFTVTATGSPAPTFAETGTLPTGVTLNATTGVLSGTPTGAGGTYPITITASNGVSPNATQSFTLTVTAPPAITSGNATTFTVGTAGTFTVTATGSPAATFSEVGTLPTGVSLNATTGVLSGTPAAGTAGSYPITITASNGTLPNATQSFTLTVNQAPAITSGSSTTFAVGTAGTFTVTATGSPAPTFAETGTLPTGVTLNATTGVLSGTPTGAGGTYPITITASNGVSPNATQSFTLTVTAPPAITSAAATTFTVGTAGTFRVTATGSPAATFSEVGTLPTGVSLNATTGVLSGTPATGTAGSYPITITAANGNLPDATQSFTLTVSQVPRITSASSTIFNQNQAGTFTVTSTGFPAPTISETGALPAGVTLVGGVLSGTPPTSAAGSYPITITAANGVLPDATQSFTLVVATVPGAPSIVSVTPGNGQVTVTWAPGSTGGQPILFYEVQAVGSAGGCMVNAPATSCTVTGLTNGVPYSFTVFAGNVIDTGPNSLPSAEVTPTSNGPIPGYWMVTSGGTVLTNGAAQNYGSPAGLALNAPIVALVPTPDRKGYWMVGSDGGVFSYGDAGYYGSTGSEHLNKPIVGMAATSDGKGYWLVASDGGVFAYGDAAFQGSLGGRVLNAPIVGMAGNGTGGYWLVGSDGGVFAYGTATFHGSAGNEHLLKPVTGIAATANGTGYYLVAADGGVFAYNAPFFGSASGVAAGVAMGITIGVGGGYTLTTDLGGAYSYGTTFFGSQINSGVLNPVISIAS